MAMLGRFNVSDHDEPDSLNSLVSKIFIHPEWNFNREDYDADISVVVLEDLFAFNAFIRPVRLPEASNKTEVFGDGTVFGWGHDNNSSKEHEETPSKIEVPAVLFRDCVIDAPKLFPAQSRRTFCAGFMGRSIAPCAGDSGGGFHIEGVCKADIYTTYTIVANFVTWIREKVQETKERVVKDVEFTCEDRRNSGDRDTKCAAGENEVYNESSVRFTMRNYRGNQKLVRKLRLDFGKARVIEGLGETFPNFEEIKSGSFVHNHSTFRIERRTFSNMTKLKKLFLYSNELTTDHYFDDLVNLEELECSLSRMPKQPKNLFKVLKNLKVLGVNGGANWKSLPDETFVGMSKLEELSVTNIRLEEISENAFNDLVGLKKMDLSGNSIAKLSAGLLKNLRNLESINLSVNKIAELTKELFANNLMLKSIDLNGNKLKIIEADFTSLPKARTIMLNDNVCVSAAFISNSAKTIREFQGIVDTQCKQKQSS